jgi:hypothetical protein
MQNNGVVTKYFSGQGILLVAKKDPTTGKPLGFRNVGNVSDLKISPKTSVLDHKESSTGARGIDKRITTEISCDVSAQLESIDKDNLAMALRGSVTDVTAGTVTAELFTAYLGTTSALENISVSAVILKGTGAKSTDTYVVDKNYTVNAESGSINIMSAAAQTAAGAGILIIEEGDDLSVAYAFAAQSKVESLTDASQEYVLRFEGLNTAEGNKACIVDIYRFSPNPLKELALINDKLGDITLEGPALADMTRTTGSKYFSETLAV